MRLFKISVKQISILLILMFLLSNVGLNAQIESSDSINNDTINEYYEYQDEYEDYDSLSEYDYVYESSGYLADLSFSVKSPIGVMNEKFNSTPLGFEIAGYKQINKSLPLYLGFGFSFDWYENNSITYFDISPEDGYEYEFSEELCADIFGVNLGLKYFSPRSFWVFNPYVQMNFEYRRAFSVINNRNLDFDETINTDFEGGSSGFGYDIGIGSLISLNSEEVFLNFKVSYNSGGGLFLYQRNDTENGSYVSDLFDHKYFPIGFLTFKIGVTFL